MGAWSRGRPVRPPSAPSSFSKYARGLRGGRRVAVGRGLRLRPISVSVRIDVCRGRSRYGSDGAGVGRPQPGPAAEALEPLPLALVDGEHRRHLAAAAAHEPEVVHRADPEDWKVSDLAMLSAGSSPAGAAGLERRPDRSSTVPHPPPSHRAGPGRSCREAEQLSTADRYATTKLTNVREATSAEPSTRAGYDARRFAAPLHHAPSC
jgi:hypothetical protein